MIDASSKVGTSLELYYYPSCPYCQKVLRFMRENTIGGIVLRNTRESSEDYDTLVRVGGKHQVPCLFIGGEPMYESDDIIAWLQRNVL